MISGFPASWVPYNSKGVIEVNVEFGDGGDPSSHGPKANNAGPKPLHTPSRNLPVANRWDRIRELLDRIERDQ